MHTIKGTWERDVTQAVVRFGTSADDLESDAFRIYDNVTAPAGSEKHGTRRSHHKRPGR